MSLHDTNFLLNRIAYLNSTARVSISKISLESCSPWYYDSILGIIRTPNSSFFEISGLRLSDGSSQPIILQNEIGYLGIICRRFNGEMHYLMQAKIEPGNINKIQLSPTIQATKSNFTQNLPIWITSSARQSITLSSTKSSRSSRQDF